MRLRHSCAMLLAVALIPSCSPSAPTAPVAPSATSDQTTQSAEPSAPGQASELAATGEPLPAGTYTRAGFVPRITVELDGAWEAVQLRDGFFDVQQLVGTPDVVAVQFARPTNVDDAEAALAAIRANDDLTEVESSTSLMDGLEGPQITVENTGGPNAPVVEVPSGTLGIDPGRRLWIALFDTDAGLLAIIVGGSIERWDEALLTAEPVLESVRIGP